MFVGLVTFLVLRRPPLETPPAAASQDKAASLEEHTGLTRSRGVF
jgi:hypothetical protein